MHILAGAVIGAAINTGITLITDLSDGKLDSGWKEYAASAAEGAITGAIGAATGGASLLVTAGASAAGGMAGNIAGQYIRNGKVDVKEAAISGLTDAAIGTISDIGAAKFMKSKLGKKVASKVDDIGSAVKGKIDDATKQVKKVLADESGYVKLSKVAGEGADNPVNTKAYKSTNRMPDEQLLNPNLNKKKADQLTEWRRSISYEDIKSERIKFLG